MGRLLFSMWRRVDRKTRDVTREFVQVVTGHGDFEGYRVRFGFTEGDGICACGESVEDIDHNIHRCPLPGRRKARINLMGLLGRYPPKLDD